MSRRSLQFKIGLSYIAVILAVLVLMNTYPLLVTEDMTFRAKQNDLQGSISVMVSALSGIERLTEENVSAAMALTEATGVSRILVTDASGVVLYDSRETGAALGCYAFYSEVVQALSGNDVFTAAYDGDSFRSRAASPVTYRNQTIGAVYAYEYDAEQAELLQSLQKNLQTISLTVGVVVVLVSLLLSNALTRRIGALLEAIRRVREGAYDYRAPIDGRDELGQLADEINSMAERLQKTEDERRRFVADASHELKTPLAGIRLLTDSILQADRMDASTAREFIEDIGQETQRLSRITENLLRLTRLDSNALEPGRRIPVRPVMERVAHMLGMVARERDVTILCEVLDECSVMATEDDLHQVLYNLAENAIKYNHPGGFVRLCLHGQGDECAIVIEDDGIGIPEEDMKHIYDRFYRVDKMRSRAAGGTGLGLSIVSDTVRRRGGTVEAEHREGGGTRFTVRFPLARGGETE